MDIKKIILSAAAIVTFIMLAASCGGDVWLSAQFGDYEVTSGLWKACSPVGCNSYARTSKTFHAVRAFSILAVLASVGCIGLAVFAMFSDSVKWTFPFIAAIAAGVCGIIAMAIFTGETNSGSYGWSYFLGWVGSVLAFVTAGIAFGTK